MLVTATTVAIAHLAARGPFPLRASCGLGGSMLATQVAIGAANDWADLERDRLVKPHKPLVRGMVARPVAAAVASGAALTSMALAVRFGPTATAAMAVGLGAGLGYDAGLKRNPASVLCWWGGLLAVPTVACAAAGRPLGSLHRLPLLAGLLAAGLHCANALPDLDADVRTDVRSFPVRLGAPLAAGVSIVATAAAAAVACWGHPAQRSGRLRLAAGGVLVGAAVSTGDLLARRSTRSSVPFRLLSPASAGLALAWLTTVLDGPLGA